MRKIKYISFITAFTLGLLVILIFQSSEKQSRSFTTENNTKNTESKPCSYNPEEQKFSRKNYFSTYETESLIGKRVRNLKCGKLKCPVSSKKCLNVDIGETGKISALIPRDGTKDFIVAVKWDYPKNSEADFAEKGNDDYLTFVGKDDSYEIIED